MSQIKTAPYGSWRSAITSDLIVAQAVGLPDVLLDGDDIYWIESRPQEGGRNVVVRATPEGPRDVTPAGFNARTRVHEYGGGAVTIADGVVYFSNFKDQRLYRQAAGAAPEPMTPEVTPAAGLRYADGRVDGARRRWIGVREDHTAGGEAVNAVVAIDLASGGPGRVLTQGYDFYASPRPSADGRLAWLCWRHPHMPWVETELWVATLGADGLRDPVKVAGGAGESIFQPEWTPDGALVFVSDRSGWWNLHCWRGGAIEALAPRAGEFGLPQWTLGLSTYAVLSADKLVCAWSEGGLGRLATLDLRSRALTPLDLPWTEIGAVRGGGDRVVMRAASSSEPNQVVSLDLATGARAVLRQSLALTPEIARLCARPRSVEFPTTGGRTAFGLYYPPHHPDYAAPEGERAPLVVKSHGGPTDAASSRLNLGIQFWTSRGIGVLDVNYGGSTGFGRAYRERLFKSWGIVDVDDCCNGALHLAREGLADGDRMAITGGSAGGYTTLAALAFRDVFKAGGSHYGIGDLGALARDTHKFESRYLDWLIGPWPQDEALYRARSPLFHAEGMKVPVAFFQGDEDAVVPPNQAEMMVDALRRRGIPVAYLLFAGEQHGFRQAANIKRALDAELLFFATQAFKVGLSF
jgi:dipeptidyl aminopeptidase/acylaminoacyl peptidase